jgi:hypothetical protein
MLMSLTRTPCASLPLKTVGIDSMSVIRKLGWPKTTLATIVSIPGKFLSLSPMFVLDRKMGQNVSIFDIEKVSKCAVCLSVSLSQ